MRRAICIGLAGLLVIASGSPHGITADAGFVDELDEHDQAVGPDASRYIAISPTRIFDSRTSSSLASDSSAVITVGAPLGVPSGDITAVIVNVTATDTAAPGFVTAFPALTPRPATSTLNIERAGQTVANLATVRTAATDLAPAIEVYTTAPTHLVVDIVGYYVRTPGDVSAGRFQALGPIRVVDTRSAGGAFSSGEVRRIDLTSIGVPADASSAVVNITAVDAPTGYWTVFPADDPVPATSSLNVSRLASRPEVGAVVANQVVTRLAGGALSVYSQTGGHLVADVFGYYTGASATASAAGRFVPLEPVRVLDTRETGRPGDDATVPISVERLRASSVDLTDATAIAINITATSSSRSGYFTAHAAGRPRPGTSNLNVTTGQQTIANHSVVPVSTTGASIYVQTSAQVVADLFGWFTGPSGPAAPGPAAPPPAAPAPPSVPPPAAPAAPAVAAPHELLYRLPNGTFARWNPCTPILYKVNASNVPAGTRALVDITFQYAGETTSVSSTPEAGTQAIIAFPTSAQSTSLTGSVVGLGGGRYTSRGEVIGGFAFVRADAAVSMSADRVLEVLLHELGHMVGLAHVHAGGSYNDNPDTTRYQDWGSAARQQTMYPVLLAPRGYASGDVQGLTAVGAAQGCLTLRALDAGMAPQTYVASLP